MTVADEVNHFISNPFSPGPRTLWGIPVVESEAVPEGFGLVGDFKRAVLFDREQTSITVGWAGDDFLRNVMPSPRIAWEGYTSDTTSTMAALKRLLRVSEEEPEIRFPDLAGIPPGRPRRVP
jgi:hypothetical protein